MIITTITIICSWTHADWYLAIHASSPGSGPGRYARLSLTIDQYYHEYSCQVRCTHRQYWYQLSLWNSIVVISFSFGWFSSSYLQDFQKKNFVNLIICNPTCTREWSAEWLQVEGRVLGGRAVGRSSLPAQCPPPPPPWWTWYQAIVPSLSGLTCPLSLAIGPLGSSTSTSQLLPLLSCRFLLCRHL